MMVSGLSRHFHFHVAVAADGYCIVQSAGGCLRARLNWQLLSLRVYGLVPHVKQPIVCLLVVVLVHDLLCAVLVVERQLDHDCWVA